MNADTRLHVPNDGNTRTQSTVYTGQSSSVQVFLKFLRNFAYAIHDKDTGNLLEYCHLIKHPKHRTAWSQTFGEEIR